ncbi:hypothetical protein Ancab_039147 [Ancistrocladus abbreviatus]
MAIDENRAEQWKAIDKNRARQLRQRATSFKKRFDMARVLISMEVCSPISKSISVMVDGHKFLIQVVAESTGETIVSRGLDREKVSRTGDERHELPSPSVVSCSLVHISGSGGEVQPGMNRGINAEKNSKLPENNDERVCNSGGIGKSHRVQYVRWKVDENSSVELLRRRYMSSPRKRSKKVIMGERRKVIKRREEDCCCTPSASLKSQDCSQKLDSSLGNSCAVGPSLLRPKQELGGKEQSLGKDWAMESGTMGPSDVLGCNRPLSGCVKKLKKKKTPISHK